MNARVNRIVCECGGELSRPLPARCPHCQAPITRVRRTVGPQIAASLLVLAIFAVLAAAVWALATQ